MLIEVIQEVVGVNFARVAKGNNFKLHFSSSTYISGIGFPTADDIRRSGKKVHEKEGRHVVMPRVFDTHIFYGYGKPRFDCIMLHGGRKKYGDVYTSEIRFEKVLEILNIVRNYLKRSLKRTCREHNVGDCHVCSEKKAQDYVFVRYSKIFWNDKALLMPLTKN